MVRGIRQSIPPNSLLGTPGTNQSANPQPVQVVKQSGFASKQWVAAFSLQPINDGYLLANISGVTALPKGTSFIANGGYLDYLFGNPAVQGNIIYRDSNANGWKVLAPGTAGYLLSTGGAAANPSWVNTIATPTPGDNSTKIATTAFVQAAIAGVNPAVAVQAATTAAANTSGLTYNNGASGIGATFTGAVNTALTIDGYTFSALGQRLLVKNDTQSPSGAFNGVYYVTQLQTVLLPLILTRALDYDMPSDINNTGIIPVINGTVNASTTWVLTSLVNTVGTDPLTYVQFSKDPGTVVTAAAVLPVHTVAISDGGSRGIKATVTGSANDVFISGGASADPTWSGLSALLDTVFGSAQGDILYRGASAWVVLAPGTNGQVLTTQGAGADPKWATASGGSGYPKGSPPTVVQSAKSNASASVTFGAAPTNGNLMIAMSVSPTASSAATGWTLVGTDTSGTDFGCILWKKAGAGESTTQTPLAGGNPTNSALVVWELNGQNASQPIVCATVGHTTGSNVQSGWTGANTWSVAHIPMDAGCIGLAMTGVASSAMTIVQAKNVGTQDQATLSGATRQFVAGHTDLGQTPTVGIILNWSGGNSDCKSMAAVITS